MSNVFRYLRVALVVILVCCNGWGRSHDNEDFESVHKITSDSNAKADEELTSGVKQTSNEAELNSTAESGDSSTHFAPISRHTNRSKESTLSAVGSPGQKDKPEAHSTLIYPVHESEISSSSQSREDKRGSNADLSKVNSKALKAERSTFEVNGLHKVPKATLRSASDEDVFEKTRVLYKRYKNIWERKRYEFSNASDYHHRYHHRKNAHYFFFNQFVYELKTLRSCFYQYVKRGCTLSVFYQALSPEPVSVFITDDRGANLHDSKLRKSGNFTLTSRHGETCRICVENYDWDQKKVFLSIRVESRRNSKLLLTQHQPVTHTILGHIRNLEVEVRSIRALLSCKQAKISSEIIANEDKDSFVIWATWMMVLAAVVTYTLQVFEIHRVVKAAETKFTYNVAAGSIRLGLLDSMQFRQ